MRRISIITLNLWNTEHWEKREACVISFVTTYHADIYCLQEVRPSTLALLDEALADYVRIEGAERGWRFESAIYVKERLFTVQGHGRVDLRMPEVDRGLFWARLRTPEGTSLFVSTVHLTHQLNATEVATGIGFRHDEAILASEALNTLAGAEEAAILCGDFNDPVHPSLIFQKNAGFTDVFTTLGLPAPVTFPCPYLSDEGFLVEAIDKIMVRGPVRPLLATSPHFLIPGGVLSDHWPVAAVLELV